MAKHNKANRKANKSTSVKVLKPCATIRIETSDSDRPTLPETRIAKAAPADPLVSRPSLSSLWQEGEPELIVFDPSTGKSIHQETEQIASNASVPAEVKDVDSLTDPALEEGFFAVRVDSIAPSSDDIELEPQPFVAPAHVLVRREKMRRVVAWTIGLFGVVSIAVVANAMMPRRQSLEMPTNSAANHQEILRSTSAKEVAPSIEVSKPLLPSQAEPTAEASVAPSASAVAPAVLVANPLKEALNLLNRGKLEAAISMADLAIEREPADATAYLYRGAALQDLGRRKLAIEAYSNCVRNATKGPVQECRALGGKK